MQLGRIRLAQNDPMAEGRQAVAAYDALMARVPLIGDADARGEILKWIGRTDSPGSPAERYKLVADAISAGVGPDDIFTNRVRQLQKAVAELGARVSNAEEAYGTLSAADAAGSAPEAGTGGLCFAGGVALLGLIVVPLLLD